MGFLDQFIVADFDPRTFYPAQDIYNDKGMEDCLQVATAMTSKIKIILTSDKGMKRFKLYIDLILV
jgi:predicted nucleic acid-binding protein